MYYNLKLTEEALEDIRQRIGVDVGCLNLKTGVWRVNRKDYAKTISEKYSIDNINHQACSIETKDLKEMCLEERRQIIGNKLQIGSIVRVKNG